MITGDDIRRKADGELLNIFQNQGEYLPEIVAWMKAEISRRGIDTSNITVRTVEVVEKEMEVRRAESSKRFLRFTAIPLFAAAVLGLVFSFLRHDTLAVVLFAGLALTAVEFWLNVGSFPLLGMITSGLVFAISAYAFIKLYLKLGLKGSLPALIPLMLSALYFSIFYAARKSQNKRPVTSLPMK